MLHSAVIEKTSSSKYKSCVAEPKGNLKGQQEKYYSALNRCILHRHHKCSKL